MLKILLAVMLVLSTTAFADTKLSAMGSLNFSTPESDEVGSADEVSKLGLGAGLRALMGIQDQLFFRSGAGLVQKNVGYENDSDDELDISFVYLNIPLTLYWQASPQVGFFGGTAINARLSDDCDIDGATSCDLRNEKTLVFPAIIGFDFSFTETMGMELSYEYGMTEVSKDLQIHSAVASFLYHFDK